MPWFVLYTKSRNEKKVATLLTDRNIKAYCPLIEVVKQWSDRKKKVSEPVFKSYVFVFLEDYKSEANTVLTTPGAVRFLWWLGQPGIVRDEEIEVIKSFLIMYKDAKISADIKKGTSVRINEGPLKEKTGEVIQVKGDKVYLKLDSLGISMIAKVQAQILTHNRDK